MSREFDPAPGVHATAARNIRGDNNWRVTEDRPEPPEPRIRYVVASFDIPAGISLVNVQSLLTQRRRSVKLTLDGQVFPYESELQRPRKVHILCSDGCCSVDKIDLNEQPDLVESDPTGLLGLAYTQFKVKSLTSTRRVDVYAPGVTLDSLEGGYNLPHALALTIGFGDFVKIEPGIWAPGYDRYYHTLVEGELR